MPIFGTWCRICCHVRGIVDVDSGIAHVVGAEARRPVTCSVSSPVWLVQAHFYFQLSRIQSRIQLAAMNAFKAQKNALMDWLRGSIGSSG